MLTKNIASIRLAHSNRFRKVSTRYARRVAKAYGFDLAKAAQDSDEVVAAKVRAWEIANGLKPRDWVASGLYEKDLGDAPPDIERESHT
jgi:hypothetical protein